MRYYGVKRKRIIENAIFYIVKFRRYCSQYTSLSKKVRKMRQNDYYHTFVEFRGIDKADLSIPEGKHYVPVCVVTADLVLREDIPKIKKGLIKMLKKLYTHKFLGRIDSEEEILEKIENMDDTSASWYNSINIGRFDFKSDNELNKKISYFDVYVRNLNSSYLLIEFHLYGAENYINEQKNIIDNDYAKKRNFIMTGLIHNRKISGSRRIYLVGDYNKSHLKSDQIFEDVLIMKWQFFNEIQKYFETTLHQKSINPPSVNIYKTNLSFEDKNALKFWDSVGLPSYRYKLNDKSKRLLFKAKLSYRYDRYRVTDLNFVVNDEILAHKDFYYSFDFQTVSEFKDDFDDNVLRFTLLESINEIAAKELIAYKLKLNKIKLRKNKLHELIKLRYLFERDMDYYRRFALDDIWSDARDTISKIFDEEDQRRSFEYSLLTESPILTKDKIINQIKILSIEFNEKTSILQHLAAYKNEVRAKNINYTMLILAIITLILIIFPDFAEFVRANITAILEISS